MVLLRNDGPQPLLFSVRPEVAGSAAAAAAGRLLDADAAAAATALQLLEVRPVRGVVGPGEDVQLQVHIAGDEWALRGAMHNPRLSFRVRVGNELSAGGEATAPGTYELTFSAECLAQV